MLLSRTPISLNPFQDRRGNALVGLSVQVNYTGAGAAPVYADATGGALLANPLTTDDNGDIAGWLDPGLYDFVVTGASVTSRTIQFLAAGGGDVEAPTIGAGLNLTPFTSGRFLDFREGVSGVNITANDPPQPDWVDEVSITTLASASVKYATDALLPPIPCAAKITTTSASVAYLHWTSGTLPALLDHHNRFYLYLYANPTANIRCLEFQGNALSNARVRVNSTTRKIEIVDGANNVQGTSNITLSATTHYRIVAHVVQGTAGTVTVTVHAGHAIAELDSFTSSAFNTGAYTDDIRAGNVNNTNLGGVYFSMSAFALGCGRDPGPYTGDDARALRVGERVELPAEGGMRVRTERDFTHDLADHYLIPAKTLTGGFTPEGSLFVGPTRGTGNPSRGVGAINRMPRIFFDATTGRAQMLSANLMQTNDPPDLAWTRAGTPPDPTGTGASTTVDNPKVDISDYVFDLSFIGCPITVNGVKYKITAIGVNGTSVYVTPTPAATASGLTWATRFYPYPPYWAGCETVSAGELRWSPAAMPFIRKDTSGLTNLAGASAVTISGFSSDDIGRWLYINNNGTLTPTVLFKITNVVGTTVTLAAPVPIAHSNVPWALAGGLQDRGIIETGLDPLTISVRTMTPTAFVDSGKMICSGNVGFAMALRGTVMTGALPGLVDTLILRDSGAVEVTAGPIVTGPNLATVPTATNAAKTLYGHRISGSGAFEAGTDGGVSDVFLYRSGVNTWKVDSDFAGGAADLLVTRKLEAQYFAADGLTGAAQASRYAGATSSGAPASGTFAVGDFVVDRSGFVWVCTAAGTPGTWVKLTNTTDLAAYQSVDRYRLLHRIFGYSRGNTVITGAGDYQMQLSGPLNTQAAASAQPGPLYLDPADHAVTGLTTKLRLTAGILVNDTAPGITLIAGLYPVGTPTGAVNVLNPNFGTVVSGSTVTFTTPGANVHAAPTSSGDFTFPAAGWYQFGVHADGAQAANSVLVLPTRLEVRNV